MDDPIKPRADTARHKPRMRPLRPGSDLAPGGQRWLCHRPDAFLCGIGHTQIEAWEAAARCAGVQAHPPGIRDRFVVSRPTKRGTP